MSRDEEAIIGRRAAGDAMLDRLVLIDVDIRENGAEIVDKS